MKYLIDFNHTATDSDIASYLATNNCNVLAEWDNFDKVFLVEASTEPPSNPIIESIILDEPMKIKPLDFTPVNTHLFSHTDPSLEKINANNNDTKDWWKVYSFIQPNFDSEFTTFSRKGKLVDVYIMDSGIYREHPDFADANIVNLYSVTPGDFNDTRGHGTAIAGVIVGKTCGITDATIKVVKIFQDGHDTLQSELLGALDAILGDHQPNTISVLNCSWIIDKNPWVENKLAMLANAGVYIMAAAGNQGTSIEDVTPASMFEAVTIGAYNVDLKPCTFSNYTGGSDISVTENDVNHGELDGWAPGEQIWVPGIQGGYTYVAGTSIATAIASAILVNNIADIAESDGSIGIFYQGMSINSDVKSGKGMFVFARQDLLDLSDPKYAESINMIATLIDKSTNPEGQQPENIYGYGKVGIPGPIGKLYQTQYTKGIEFIDPLLDGWILTPEGIVLAYPTVEQGPTGTDIEKTHTFRFKRLNVDDTVDECVLTTYILAADKNPGDLPPDHTINIKLQNICSNYPFGPCQFYMTAVIGCGTSCPGGGYCCGSSKISYAQCFCTFSDRRLKSNIVKIGTHKLGVGLYEFDIFGERKTGVMADEVLKVMPEAVVLDKSGYYKVCYDMID